MYLLLTFWFGAYKGTSGSHSTSRHLPTIMSTSIEVVNSYWRCVKPGCSGRLVLHDDAISNSPSHNHGEQRAEITVHRAKKLLKQRAATSDMNTKHIVASAVADLDFECRAKLGCWTNCLENMVRSARHAANRHPTNPTSLETLAIPPSYLQSAIQFSNK